MADTDSPDTGVSVEAAVDGDRRTVSADALFAVTGCPNTEGIGLDTIGVDTDETGAIVIDETFEITVPAVYAAGDVIGDLSLEAVAVKEGHHAHPQI